MSSEIRKYYDAYHARCLEKKHYDLSNLPLNLQLVSLAAERGLIPKNGELLEVGCGSGLMQEALTDQGYNVVGLDLSRVPLTFRLNSQTDSLLIQADGVELPFAANLFDAVLCFDSLEHVSDMSKLIKEIVRVTKPDGVFIFRTPNILFSIPWELIKGRSFQEQARFHPQLQSFFSLKRCLKEHGFDLMLFKLGVAEATTLNKLGARLGPLARMVRAFPWGILPLAGYPVFSGFATKIDETQKPVETGF